MEEHLVAGDEVTVLGCDASLAACDANPSHRLAECMVCIGMRQDLVSLLSKPVKTLPLMDRDFIRGKTGGLRTRFASIEDLRSYTWKGLDIGSSIFSSLVTATGTPTPDPGIHAARIRMLVSDYVAVYLTAEKYLEERNYGRVYIFNGRFVVAQAWVRACEEAGCDYVTHERLAMPDRAIRIHNGVTFDMGLYAAAIENFWRLQGSHPETIREGRDFFEERPHGKMTGWFSFVSGQRAGQFPEGWSPGERNVGIFTSTDSEFAGLPESFSRGALTSQIEAYDRLCTETGRICPGIRFYLRVHPNSVHEKKRWWDEPSLRRHENLRVIPPESSVSTYLLLTNSEKAVAFMSSVGVEATYWAKPSIVLSNAPYSGIGAVYEPRTAVEAAALVADKNLVPKPQINAVKYGAYIRLGGEKLPYSDALDHCKLTFKGQLIGAHEKVLAAYWRWKTWVEPSRLPQGLKKVWEWAEWSHVHWGLRGDLAKGGRIHPEGKNSKP